MPRLPAALGVILSAALCIGWAVLRYPQVNQQVWEMVQAGRQPSPEGNCGFLRLGLAVPANVAIAQAEQRSMPSPTPATCDPLVTTELEDTNAGFAMVPIAGYVGTDQAKARDENGRGEPSRLETVQVTLAVPPQMAILNQPNGDRSSRHGETEAPDAGSGQIESDRTGGDTSDSHSEVAPTVSREEGPPVLLPLSKSQNEDLSPAGEAKSTAITVAGIVDVAQPDKADEPDNVSPSSMVADAGKHDDYVDPPLVPVIRNSSATGPTASLADTGDFELVAPHEAVARLAPSPPVTLPSDLPLVNIYRNRWFAAEKPQRLPPVEEESQGPDASAGMEPYWNGAPSIPLYPATGR